MTRNQIEYLKWQETARANQAQESLTRWRDRQNIAMQQQTLDETSRHNQAQEQMSLAQHGETLRHNLAYESNQQYQIAEQQRANKARESETYRSNRAAEIERNRSNLASEALTASGQSVSRENAQLGYSAQMANVAEQSRANKASEQLRADQQQEQHRSNLAQENLSAVKQAQYWKLTSNAQSETNRHNEAVESAKDTELGISAFREFAKTALTVLPLFQ